METMASLFKKYSGYVMEDHTQKGKFFAYEFTMGDFGYLGNFELEEVKVLKTLKKDHRTIAVLENIYEIDFNNNELFDNLEMALNEF